MGMPCGRGRRSGLAIVIAGFCMPLVAAIADMADKAFPPPTSPPAPPSTMVLDRHERLLAAFTAPDERWRLPVAAEDVDPLYLKMLIAYEDRRFVRHGGIDARAVLRAAAQALARGRIVSGASTLTMQTARLLERGSERTLARKLRESVRALQLERRLSKNQILSLYLTLAPYGGNLEGIRAASLAYFGREPKRLTLAQAALLVALPQSPETRRPDRHPEAARRARDRVLDRMADLGVIGKAAAAAAKAEPVPTRRRPFPALSPHLAARSVAGHPDARILRLTLDRDLQASMEALVRQRAVALGRRISAALLVIDNRSGEVLASVGSPDRLDAARRGFVDMTRAPRSPGSALKPFIYGLAFEAGIAHPETLLEDRPTSFGGYMPKNFDQGYQGTVTAREALQMSLNVPAVALLDALGPARLMVRLSDAGAHIEIAKDEAPNLAIALGGLGITLTDLARLYAGLARGGSLIELKTDRGAPYRAGTVGRRLLDPVAAWYVNDILTGTPRPDNASGAGIAYKTGTSYGYRDAWAVGYDGAHTIAVWVGRPDGAPIPGMTGRAFAAPILFDAFSRIEGPRAPLPPRPAGAILATTATLPPPLRALGAAAGTPQRTARTGLRIAYPPDGAHVAVGDSGAGGLAFRIDGARHGATLLIDGRPYPLAPHEREGIIPLAERGFLHLTVIDPTGASDSVTIFAE